MMLVATLPKAQYEVRETKEGWDIFSLAEDEAFS